MKKLLLLSILITSLSYNVKAQDIRFGLKTGLNFSKLNSDEAGFNEMSYNRSAFHIGALVEFTLSDNFSIQPELYYSSEGGMLKSTEEDEEFGLVDLKTNINTNYMSLPIMFKYYTGKNLYIEAGPQMDFLVSADIHGQASNNFQSEVYPNEDIKDQLDSNNYGLGIGIGYKASNGIFLNTRYVLGLSDLTKNEFSTVKSGGFHFSVGFML